MSSTTTAATANQTHIPVSREGTIVLTRPISELKDYLTHLQVPSIHFLIRLVKTCAMAIFHRHFYDVDHVLVANGTGNYMHTFDGPLKSEASLSFKETHPFMLEHAAFLQPKKIAVVESKDEEEGESMEVEEFVTANKIQFETFQTTFKQPLSLTHVVTYYRETLKVEGFPEKSKGALADIWNNNNFEVTYSNKV